MKKQLLVLLLFSLCAVVGSARTVTGTVTSATDGEPLFGASVMVQGSTSGTATDIDGKYSVEVPGDASVITFSYVGMNPQSITVGDRDVINVQLTDNATVLDEVVVTAMGQVQEKKKLNFAVQALNSDDVTAGQTANFVDALQGKVAGAQVSMTGGSPNASSQIIIRAISSINESQSNEPLFVIDGMPVRGGASSAADINPNDIESMSVLKGAAASALYGQEGSNGVILITTKSGKVGSVVVTASGGWEFSNVARKVKLQDKYIGGSSGIYTTNSSGGWGPPVYDEETFDNMGNFLGTGFMQKYDLSVSGGTEKFSAYASANYMNNQGVVPNDYKNRLGIFIKAEFNPSDKVKIMMSTNFVENKSRGFGNSMSTVYGWSINRDMRDYVTEAGYPNWSARYDDWDALSSAQRLDATPSPYYSRYMDKSETQSNRTIINGLISYEPIKNLVFTAKVNYDKGYSMYDGYVHPRFSDDDFATATTPPDESSLAQSSGSYTFQPSRNSRITAQLLGNYAFDINDDFSFNIFVGGEYSETKGLEATLGGYNFVLGGDYFSFNNVDPNYLALGTGSTNLSMYHTDKNKYGYFGELRFDYKGMAQVSVTGRYDGSSTLKQSDPTYFYPSVTGGVIFSELFNLSNSWFSYGKIRGNWAKVGKDAPRYAFTRSYKQWSTLPDGGYSVAPTMTSANWLEPEMTSTWEIGADLRFFNSRTRLDFAYYSTKVDNQIVTMRVSPTSGLILQTFNSGTVQNRGVEITASQDILQMRDFTWTANVNFSFNRGKLLSLPDEQTNYLAMQLGSDFYCASVVGESTTSMVGKDYQRTDDGQIICDENGYPLIDSGKEFFLGDREPKFLLGLGSTFTWKDLSLSFLFDGRCGGKVYNYASRTMMYNGMNYYLAKYRNHQAVVKGVVANGDGTYRENTTPVILDSDFIGNYFDVPSNFIEDGSYIRLSYVTIAYDFTNLMKKLGSRNPIQGLQASVTGRNLFLLTKYTGPDPQIMSDDSTSGPGSMGIDTNYVPATRSFNFNVKITF